MTLPEFFGTGVGIIVLIILIIQAILWFFVPFVIFGINKKLKVFMRHQLEKEGMKLSWWDGEIRPINRHQK